MKKISIHIFIASFLFLPIFLHAQDINPTTDSSSNIRINNPFSCGLADNNQCTLIDLINQILDNVVMPIAGVAVVIYIIYAGFTFVTAQGKPAEITIAKNRLLWGLIGAGILLGAAGISGVVTKTIDQLLGKP